MDSLLSVRLRQSRESSWKRGSFVVSLRRCPLILCLTMVDAWIGIGLMCNETLAKTNEQTRSLWIRGREIQDKVGG